MHAFLLAAAFLFQQAEPPAERTACLAVTPAAMALDTGALRHDNGRTPPMLRAVSARGATPRIDGRFDDAVWSMAEPAARFTQRSPVDGQAASEATEVRVAYDDDALYVAAHMFDSNPSGIVQEMGRRDNQNQDDHFEFSVDSYHDHRTSFFFKVNSLGVKGDAAYSNDGGGADYSWDPVWEVATQVDSLGWTAEFRIPLSQLRFSSAPSQVWGINFNRFLRREGETDLWAYSSMTDSGFESFFGHLVGLENLPRPQRLELLPYATGMEERLAVGSPANPFNDGSRRLGQVGLDLKYGITSNLTLDATVNPDFGQVEADPAEVNLTAFETYFGERRPFFVEGSGIFTGGNQQYFYSRRIGRAPQRYVPAPDGGFVDQPTEGTILGAAKLTGRTAGGWSLGLLESVTSREYATLSDASGERTRQVVEPLTNSAVLRARRDYRGGASTIGIIGTALNRRLDDPGLDFLRSGAYAGGMDLSHRFRGNRYRLSASLGGSYITGDTSAIRLAQTSSARYFQRPDADHVALDPSRRSLAGWTAAMAFARLQGRYTWSVSGSATSPGFEINDLGYQTRADRVNASAYGTRRWTTPNSVFFNASASLQANASWNHAGDRLATAAQANGDVQFRNYWGLMGTVGANTRAWSDNLTRGGPMAVTPAGWITGLRVSSDQRRQASLWGGGNASGDELGSWGAWVFGTLTWRPTSMVSVELTPEYGAALSRQQYVGSSADATAVAAFGRRYIFADVRQNSVAMTSRFNLTLSPTLSLQLYAQPYVATGDYRSFKELEAPRSTDYLVYGVAPGSVISPVADPDGTVGAYDLDPDGSGPRPTRRIGNPDFSYRSLRGNAVLRWEYRPGSTFFLVWTKSCSDYGANPRFEGMGAMGELCRGPSDDVVAVKLNYWVNF